jgi:hypothetical protein
MNGNRPSHPAPQLRLTFLSNTIGPRFPRAVWSETQALLAQLLVGVVRGETPLRGGEDERQDS